MAHHPLLQERKGEERIEDTTAVQEPKLSEQGGPITPWLEADAAQLL